MCNNVESTLSRFDLFLELNISREKLFPRTSTQKQKKKKTGDRGRKPVLCFSPFSLNNLSTVPSLTYYGSWYPVNMELIYFWHRSYLKANKALDYSQPKGRQHSWLERLKIRKAAELESALLKNNKYIAPQSHLHGGGQVRAPTIQTSVKLRDFVWSNIWIACFGCFTFKLSKFANFKALFPAVTMDIRLLVVIKMTHGIFYSVVQWIKAEGRNSPHLNLCL